MEAVLEPGEHVERFFEMVGVSYQQISRKFGIGREPPVGPLLVEQIRLERLAVVSLLSLHLVEPRDDGGQELVERVAGAVAHRAAEHVAFRSAQHRKEVVTAESARLVVVVERQEQRVQGRGVEPRDCVKRPLEVGVLLRPFRDAGVVMGRVLASGRAPASQRALLHMRTFP